MFDLIGGSYVVQSIIIFVIPVVIGGLYVVQSIIIFDQF